VLWVTPVFGVRSLPAPARVALGVLVSAAVLPPGSEAPPPLGDMRFFFSLATETVLGLLLGFASLLVFTAVRGAGALADLQIGLNAVSMFDPTAQANQTPLETLANIVSTLLFLGMNAHHQLLLTLRELAHAVPAGNWTTSVLNANAVPNLVAATMESTVRLALPVIAVTLVTDVGLALASRMVPQLQPFFFGAPIKTLLGLSLLIAAFPLWSMAVIALFDNLPRQLFMLLAK
jgi:flagellar biosynthetic protein FliR